MKPVKLILLLALLPAALFAQTDTFPDGKPVPAWFSESGKVDVSALGPQYVVTHITLKAIQMHCRNFFQVRPSDKYAFSNFSFEDIDVEDDAAEIPFSTDVVPDTHVRNVRINGVLISH